MYIKLRLSGDVVYHFKGNLTLDSKVLTDIIPKLIDQIISNMISKANTVSKTNVWNRNWVLLLEI